MLSITSHPLMLLPLIKVLLLIVGCFMETIAAISILVSVLMPAVLKAGIDPVQFGVIMVLFVLWRVARMLFDRTVTAVAPFLIPLLGVIVLISIFPQITLYLPTLGYR